MGDQYIQPTTVTDSGNNEITSQRTPEGWVVADGQGNSLVTLGVRPSGEIGLLFNDQANNRMFLGLNSSGNPFGKLSQEGVDVFAATDDQTIWNITNSTLKVVTNDVINLPTVSLNTGGANYGFNIGTTVEVAHGLPYTPAILAFVEQAGTFAPTPWEFSNGITATSFCRATYRVVVDATHVYGITEAWGYNVNTSVVATTARYYLLRETAG